MAAELVAEDRKNLLRKAMLGNCLGVCESDARLDINEVATGVLYVLL